MVNSQSWPASFFMPYYIYRMTYFWIFIALFFNCLFLDSLQSNSFFDCLWFGNKNTWGHYQATSVLMMLGWLFLVVIHHLNDLTSYSLLSNLYGIMDSIYYLFWVAIWFELRGNKYSYLSVLCRFTNHATIASLKTQ